jgi:pimeloyl-ACP methyl ester carboxylesterase
VGKIQESKNDMGSERKNSARGLQVLLILVACFVAAGCTLAKLKKDVKESLASTILVGHVSTPSPGNGPIVVAAYAIHQGKKEIAHHTILHDSGEYELMVAPGDYYVFGFWDKNSNLIYDAGEPAGQYGDPKVVSVPAGGVVLQIDFVIPEKGNEIGLPQGFQISSVRPQKLQSRLAGAIADLDDERFADENGKKGFWEPVEFYKEFGGNIYFLEPYDPKKIPILFIHGAGGSPTGWKYFVDHIDRTRFQPWFFYYPTGARIKSMSYLLYWKLFNLQVKYRFDKLFITAHSMGGLVARSFLVDYVRYCPYVKLFISLATPWGGDRMAEYGVSQSPAVIPSWIDMQPEGEFIQSLYRTKIPETTSFYMFSGHRGGRNPFQSNNDGTISLSSILDLRPQAEAKMNYAFNEDHASIAFSREVLAQYNTIIHMHDEESAASHQGSGGYLRLHFSYNDPVAEVRPWPSLILRPAGKKEAETVITLSADDSGRILGPFPPGDYSASMIAVASKAGEKDIPLSIESGKTGELSFVLTPDGTVSGYVTAAVKAEDRPAGMPADRYLPADQKIAIQTISLSGAGIRRVLYPLTGENINHMEYLISRVDFCYDGSFFFFGLSAGVYELVIHARGYQPLTQKYTVIPGRQEEQRVSELKLEKQ